MKYQHKQNGKVMEIIKEDKKASTYTIRFDDGKTSIISPITLKRWYVPMEEQYDADAEECVAEEVATLQKTEADYVAEVMEQKKELGIECPPITEVEIVSEDVAGDGTPLAEVGKEIVEQAKARAQEAKKEKKSQDVDKLASQLIEIVESFGFSAHHKSGSRTMAISSGGKNSYGMYIGGTKCVIGMAGSKVPKGFTADRVRNCPQSHSFDIAYSELNKLTDILIAIKKEEK